MSMNVAWKVASVAAFGAAAATTFTDARAETKEAGEGGFIKGMVGTGGVVTEALCAAEIGVGAIGAKLLVEHAEHFGGTTAKMLQSKPLQVGVKALAPLALGIAAGRIAGAVVGGTESALTGANILRRD